MKSIPILAILMIGVAAPGGVALNESEMLENASELDDCIPTGILDSAGSLAGGRSPPSDPIYPTFTVCKDIQGTCTVTEVADTSIKITGWHVIFYGEITVNPKVLVTTILSCSGFAEVHTLSWGGMGLRDVTTQLGSTSSPVPSSDLAATTDGAVFDSPVGRDTGKCRYVSQLEQCTAVHSVGWAINKTYRGRIISNTAGLTACAPLDIFNSALAAIPKGYPVLEDVLPAEYYWEVSVCKNIEVQVANQA